MIYLISQMALFLVLAALTGVFVGWWSNSLKNRVTVGNPIGQNGEEEPTQEDIFAIKMRLDNCFDDNAKLRRDLKAYNKEAEILSKKQEDIDPNVSVNDLNDKISVLMDDLQMRDDTILVLERELEAARKKS